MKKFRFLFTFALATMLVLVACSKEENKTNPEENSKGKVQLTAKATNGATKVVFGDKVGSTYPVTWSATGEAVKLIELITPTGEDMRLADYTSEDAYTLNGDQTVATFTFTLKESADEGTYDYYSVYPESAYQSTTTSSKHFYFKIPEVQTPLANSPDPAALVYFADAKGFTAQQTSLTLNYNHPLVSLGRVTIKNASAAIGAGEVIESVTINVPSGGYQYKWETNEIVKVDATHKETVTIKTDNLTTTGDFDIWFACGNFGGFKVSHNDVLSISLNTDEETYTRNIEVTSDISFNGGRVSHFTVDMSTATTQDFSGTYLIGSTNSEANPIQIMTNELSTGSTKYLIALNTGVTVADYMSEGPAAFNDFAISSNAWVLTKVAGGYTLRSHQTGKYVDWTSGNSAKLSDTEVVLSVVGGGESEDVLVVKKGDERSLQYNYNGGTNSRFAFYASSQCELHFVPVTVKEQINPPTDVNAVVSGNTINVTWSDAPSVDHYVVGCTGQEDKNIAQGVQAASFTGLADGDYEVTIYAVPTNTATYTNSVTVTKTGLHVGGVNVYKQVTSITSGKAYLIVAVADAAPSGKESNIGTWAGKPVATGKNYDYLLKQAVTITSDGITMTNTTCEFVFTAGTNPGEYTIQQSDGRYLYKANDSYNNYNVNEAPASGQYWTVSFDTDGFATIKNVLCNKWAQFSSNYGSFGCYSSDQANGYKPMLFEKQ